MIITASGLNYTLKHLFTKLKIIFVEILFSPRRVVIELVNNCFQKGHRPHKKQKKNIKNNKKYVFDNLCVSCSMQFFHTDKVQKLSLIWIFKDEF